MSKTYTAALSAIALLAGSWTAQAASSSSGKDKPSPPSIAVQRVSLQPLPAITDRIGGLRILITQVNFPGVSERSACRIVIRAINEGRETVAAHTLVHTFDTDKDELNTWMVPTGTLAPGQTSERLYSCKIAQYMVLDRDNMTGWPGRCTINGEERSPCPLSLSLEANLNVIAKD
ncbi:MAG: hypothetical protein H7Y60_02130 [Rhodospirillaceae bacterium]|nr:hypothetical protein [Rhodospirillales bacterium]